MDQISDLLTRIRNASLAKRYEVRATFSKMKEAILAILKSEGFLSDFELLEENGKKEFKITISKTKPPVHLKQLSKPGRRLYTKTTSIPRPLRGFGLIVVSTSKGLVSGKEAVKQGIGGELICEIW